MYTILGITGNVGGATAKALLAAGKKVRGVVRDPARAAHWAQAGVELVTADIHHPEALAQAMSGSEGVFILVPPNFDPSPGFPEAQAIGATLKNVLETARPAKVVYLSTIGADAKRPNLLSQHTIIEETIHNVSLPLTFLRPAWFMENCQWDAAPARDRGVIPSFLQPLDKPVPMVATADIGQTAAGLLQKSWSGRHVVELEGPSRVSPHDIAATFARLLARPVKMEVVPRDTWEGLFTSQGMKNPLPRIQMLDGFNEGWIEFENGGRNSHKGVVTLEPVLKKLLER